MKYESGNAANRAADRLMNLLDAVTNENQLAAAKANAARDAILTWLNGVDDRSLARVLHKLYHLAERQAAERAARMSGTIRLVRDPANQRIRIPPQSPPAPKR